MISVVVPVLNERECLAGLAGELAAAGQSLGDECEFIFVDDGSTDGSWAEVRRLQQSEPRIRGLRLRRNFGKSAALAAGFRIARGNRIVMIDGDLQDDPAEIPGLLAQIESGDDLVNGWKQDRRDPWHKTIPSRVFNAVVGWMTGVRLHDHNCGLKAMRAEVVRELRLYGELHRFIPVLAAARGFRVSEKPVRHRPRTLGHSKFGAGRFVHGFLDLLTVKFLTGYGRRPLHLLGSLGLVAFLFGAASLAYLAGTWLVRLSAPDRFEPVHTRALLGYAIASLLFGTQLLSMGFLAELIAAQRARADDDVSIAEEA
ncbi:MAG: glycosyltransferase family 2 protein [Gemmataceae bacterium]|nr:glycosyltransferase family 2 protein [Gemmataceae bacterium]